MIRIQGPSRYVYRHQFRLPTRKVRLARLVAVLPAVIDARSAYARVLLAVDSGDKLKVVIVRYAGNPTIETAVDGSSLSVSLHEDL